MNIKIGVLAIAAGFAGAVLFSQSQRPAAMPELNGAVGWLNSGPLNAKSLRGKIVLVNFWTYTCINSLRPMPYVKSWAAKYKDAGLVVVGVHTPEFSFEHERSNVEWATRTFNIGFPGGHRQWLQHLAGVSQRSVAGAIYRRWKGTDSLPPLRRGRIR
jgi:thiol-disulfide isomerase/thioredoxin